MIKSVNDDFVSRQSVLQIIQNEVHEDSGFDYGKSEALFQIGQLDGQDEVIHCEDCAFGHGTSDGQFCKFCDQFTDEYGEPIEVYFPSDFFCGYAQRREKQNG